MLSSPCFICWGIYTISNIYPDFRLAERFLERTTVLWKSCLFWNVFINLIKRLHREMSNQLLMDKKMLFPIIFVTLIPTHSPLSCVSKSCCSCSSCQWAQVTISYCLVGWKPDQCDNVYPMQRSTISALLSVNSLQNRGSISLGLFLVSRKLFWRFKLEFLVALYWIQYELSHKPLMCSVWKCLQL